MIIDIKLFNNIPIIYYLLQFDIRQNKIYLTLFIGYYRGGTKQRIKLSWVVTVLLLGPPQTLTKCTNTTTAMITKKNRSLDIDVKTPHASYLAMRSSLLTPRRILHSHNAGNRDVYFSYINDEEQCLLHTQFEYQLLDDKIIGATFCLHHLQTSYIIAHLYLPIQTYKQVLKMHKSK